MIKKFLIMILLFLVILVGVALCRGKQDYCALREQLCQKLEHIGCTPNSFKTTKCSNMIIVPMTDKLKDTIVNQHNLCRQATANGLVNSLPSAAAMRQMYWDDELAYLAKIHISHCTYAHDQCRATTTFPYAGQNLAIMSSTAENNDSKERLEYGIKMWFDESKDTRPGNIDSIPRQLSKIGHFTVMMRENNTAVGCAYIKYTKLEKNRTWYTHMITCNYADNNFIGEPVYNSGKPCINCESALTTCSTKYPGLCV